ncbi:MAG: DUF4097 domain-containing protein [Gemmatimonadota bacterium]|nr:DUF4097 domain-containing protein [Gemmatimonadota bacterium]
MNRTASFRVAAALTATAVFAAAANAQTQSVSLRGDSVSIYNLAGRTTIEAGSGSDVVIEITRGGADASRLDVKSGMVRGRESLRIIYPDDRIVYRQQDEDRGYRNRTMIRVRDDGTFNDNDRDGDRGRRVELSSSSSGMDAHADLKVLVPRGKRVALNLGLGDVNATNVNGDLSIDVAAATVVTRSTTGKLSIDAGSGRVDVSDATGDVNIDAGSGGSTIARVKGGWLKVDVGSGRVRLSDADVTSLSLDAGSGGVNASGIRSPDVKIDAGSGGVDVQLLSSPRKLDIDAGSGGVTIRAPADLSAEIEVETGSGDISTDFLIAMTGTSRRNLRGKIGGGSGRIHIETGSGGVRLLKN